MQLSERQADGATLHEHLMAVQAVSGRVDPMLQANPLPAAGQALWGAFCELQGARGGGFGPSALPPSEVLAWCALNGVRLRPWEVQTLRMMDAAVLAEQRRQQESASAATASRRAAQ